MIIQHLFCYFFGYLFCKKLLKKAKQIVVDDVLAYQYFLFLILLLAIDDKVYSCDSFSMTLRKDYRNSHPLFSIFLPIILLNELSIQKTLFSITSK